MNTPRWILLGAALVGLAACAGSGSGSGRLQERASDTDAAMANMNLGAGYLRQGRTDLAIERLQRAIVQNPRLVEAHSTIAVAYDQIGSLPEAEEHYRRAAQLDPNNGTAANAYAVFLCRQNRWNDAEPYFERAVANPTYATPAVALTNAGVCARAAGAEDQAAEKFRAALQRDPTFADALLNMLDLSYQSGNYIQARAFVQRYLAAHPATAPVLWMCFNVERELNDQAAADRCAAQLRSGFRGSEELAQLEAQQRQNGR
jgi:type IV pilus assembly protein PilF